MTNDPMVSDRLTESAAAAPEPARDLVPLAWVLDEVRKSVLAASKTLERLAGGAGAPVSNALALVGENAIGAAQQQYHRVAGVLELVQQPVAARFARALEDVAHRFAARTGGWSEADATIVRQAGFALIEYLEDQLGEHPRPSVGLFPQYRQVQELAGAHRIHVADMWSLPWRWRDPVLAAAPAPESYGSALRARFDRGTLQVMQGGVAAAADLAGASLGLAASARNAHARIFWKLAAAFHEALAHGALAVDRYVKSTASQTLLQYSELARTDGEPSERVARDLLFFCALAEAPAPDVAPTLHAVRAAWNVGQERLAVYQEPVFGLYDPEALAQAQRRIAAIKNAWSALAGGDAAHLDGVLSQLAALTDAMKALLPPGEPLMAELDAVRQKIAQSRQPPGPELAMETAAALLFLEASTTEFRPRDVRFTERLKRLAERLSKVRQGGPVPRFEPWMEQLYRQLNDKEAMGTVVDELRVGLAQTEQYLDRFFRDPGNTTPLEPVPGWLSEMHGVLSVLGMDQAALAVSRIRAQVGELRNAGERPSGAALTALFQKFGNNFGTLGFLIDTLNYQPVLARKLFAYDEAHGELTYVPGRTPTEAAPALTTAAPVVADEAVAPLADQAGFHSVPTTNGTASTDDAAHLPGAVGFNRLPSDATGMEPTPAVTLPSEGSVPSDDDRALLDIFLGEAHDVIATGQQALEALAKEPADHDQVVLLRRGFHTLKGSAGMLGLAEFSMAARSFENLLNAALAQEQPLDARARSGAANALAAMAHWIRDLDGGHDDAWRAAPFAALADALLHGGEPPAIALEPAAAAPAPHPDASAEDMEPVLPGMADGAQAEAAPAQTAHALPELPLLPSLDLPPATTPTGVFSTWGDEPAGAPVADVGSALHPEQPDPAPPPIEAEAHPVEAAPVASLHIGALEISEPLYNSFLKEADDWSEQLEARLSGWARGVHAGVPEDTSYYAHSLAGSSATVGLNDLAALARAVEAALDSLNDRTRDMARGAGVLIAAATEIRAVLHQFAAGILKRPDAAVLASVQALLPWDAATARAAGFARADLLVSAADPFDFDDAGDEPVVPAAALAPAAKSPATAWLASSKGAADSLDHDLFPIFEEEAGELLPQLGTALRHWVEEPADTEARAQVRRVLHTLKGSARLVGALTLGDMAHDAESAIEAMPAEHLEATDIQPLVERFDLIDETFQRLRSGASGAGPAAPAPVEAAIDPAAPAPAPAAHKLAGPTPLVLTTTTTTTQQTVRVHPELLDRLLASSSEVTTSRARLNSGVAQMRDALNELASSVVRLRRHVRDVELQVEAETPARYDLLPSGKPDFDPLEFDRYTKAQELTRMMAESVDDVETVERGLRRLIESGEDELATQARQSRELQHDLVRTRMVEFDSVAERLHRVVRQAAAESGKQARLEIAGGAIELDRAVLDRMVPSFEHLLRNSVVHGIEAPALRSERGKDPTGLITIAIRQTGNDVSIAFRDDGAGLALDRIRARALDAGLIQPGDKPDASALARFIFKSGFTTAEKVTELAGRGVGMDVVQADIEALGGRIEVESEAGQGTSFHLTLPVTTALTRVVLMRAGDLVFGVPSGLVETVRRATATELERAYAQEVFPVGAENLPFFWAGALLQRGVRGQVDAQSASHAVVIFRSAARRIAVHVDEMLGNQEVLVKGLGPQLSRLPGLVAATVLTTGAVALIYNPVAMVPAYGEHKQAVADTETPAAAGRAPNGGAGAAPAGPPLILVVDDSITVRRVMQRLLRRQGYRVALAADGEQGLDQIQQERPALVLTDIEMPRMDGFELLRAIRADGTLAGLPVVVITSRAAEKHRDHARDLGASHYLGKPYSENELLGLVRTYAPAPAPAPTLAR